ISKEHKQARKESASERVMICSFRTQSERLRSHRRTSGIPGVIWLSLAACLVIVAGAYFYNLHQMTETGEVIRAKLSEIHGDVIIERGNNEIHAQDNEGLFSGDIIKTDKSEEAKVKYDNESTVISISEKTELNIHEEQGAKRVDIRKGKIECDIAPQPAGKPMKFYTSLAEAEVLGTQFGLVSDYSKTLLNVEQGRLMLTRLDNRECAEVTPHYEGVVDKGNSIVIIRPEGSLSKGLVAYWPGTREGDTLIDMSGNGNDGKIAGEAAGVKGFLGDALELDGKDDYIAVNNPQGSPEKGPFTIGMWVRTDVLSQSLYTPLFSSHFKPGGAASSGSFQIEAYENSPSMFRIRSGGIKGEIGDFLPVWMHMAVTFDGQTITTFHNGRPMETVSAGTSLSLKNYAVGTDKTGNRFFKGQVDEVCIYNRALSKKEISQFLLRSYRKTADKKVETAEEFNRLIQNEYVSKVQAGDVVLQEDFKAGLQKWVEIDQFDLNLSAQEREKKATEIQRKWTPRKTYPFRNVKLEEVDIGGIKTKAMVFNTKESGAVVRLKEKLIIGSGLEVTMKIFIEGNAGSEKQAHIRQLFSHVYIGGWAGEMIYSQGLDAPRDKWAVWKGIICPHRDKTGYGSEDLVIYIDGVPRQWDRLHCYHPIRTLSFVVYGYGGKIYIADVNIRKLDGPSVRNAEK
ncbi:LamG-like jellyroll fold domain-containing protein, partial [Planctomycetota bacterium]